MGFGWQNEYQNNQIKTIKAKRSNQNDQIETVELSETIKSKRSNRNDRIETIKSKQ